jgi:DNA-binding IclR family transcriptional regulator
MTSAAPDYSIAVVVRTLDLLETLAAAGAPLGPTELAARLGTTKSAAYRILATLELRGYVRKDPATARYRLGTRLAYLGERSLAALDLRRAARGALETLYQRFHETVNLGVREGQEIVYIDMIESDQGLRMAARLGGRDALHATALGKAMLAYWPEQQRAALLAGPLPARTPHTITDRAALAQELDHIRAAGIAEDREENERGAGCFGAPIFDHTGAVIAAISIAAPASRLDDTRARAIATTLAAAARDITTTLGGHAPEVG